MTYIPREPVIVLTAGDARMLWQAARLNELRLKHRSGDSHLYQLLVQIYEVGLLELRTAGAGNEPRQSAASEERSHWTVKQLAKATGRAERTVRLDIESNTLPATKAGGAWIVPAEEALTYIARN